MLSSNKLAAALSGCKIKVSEPDFVTLMSDLDKYLPEHKPTYRDPIQGLEAMSLYVDGHTPELFQDRPLNVLEIGPGMGWWLLLAKELGHNVLGVDLPSGEDSFDPKGDNLKSFVSCYQAITEHLDLNVQYAGFNRYLNGDSGYWLKPNSLDMIHSRGSMSGVLHSSGGVDSAHETTRRILDFCSRVLKPKGILYVAHNHGAPARAFCDAVDALNGSDLSIVENTPEIAKLAKS